MKGLNKFLRNKNTVTILGIILILFLLFIGFNATIQSTVNPISVPVAKEKILPETQITQDKVQYASVSKIVLGDNVLTSLNDIIGKYANVNVTIPAGSMFYKEWLVNSSDLPGNWLKQVDFSKGEEAYYFRVDVTSTFGNSILPDSYIDIYMKATDDNNNVIYGKLFRNIKILAVHDSSGNNVFSDPENVGTPANLVFALSHDNYNLLMRAEYLSTKGVDLVIAPQGENTTNEEGALVSSATLRDYVNNHTSSVTDDQIQEAVNDNKTTDKSSKNNKGGLSSLLG